MINLKSVRKYFILVIFDNIPYFDKKHNIKRYDIFSEKDKERYKKLE